MRNKFKAQCFKCSKWFKKGKAYLHRDHKTKTWKCHCLDCFDEKHETNRVEEEKNKTPNQGRFDIEEFLYGHSIT